MIVTLEETNMKCLVHDVKKAILQENLDCFF